MLHSLYYTTGTIDSSSIQSLSLCDLGVGLNSKQRQRQDTNVFSCKLHLLTLELEDKTVEKNQIETLEKNAEEKPYNN